MRSQGNVQTTYSPLPLRLPSQRCPLIGPPALMGLRRRAGAAEAAVAARAAIDAALAMGCCRPLLEGKMDARTVRLCKP